MNPAAPLEERIRAGYDGLSPSHRRLVEYLLEHGHLAAFSTARQLADALGISESTVVRLAPELGYEGFPALQAEFQQRLLSRVEWRPPLREAIENMPEDPEAILRQVLENDIASIQHTLASITAESFRQAASALLEARTIHVLGLRTSAAHAIYTVMRLRHLRPKTRLLASHFGDLPDQLLAMEPGDLLIAICYHRYAADTVRALRYARGHGIRTLVVTDDPLSPPARAGEIVLIAYGRAARLFHSLVAPLSLLNALVATAAVLDKERAGQELARAYNVIEEFDVLLAPALPAELRDNGTSP